MGFDLNTFLDPLDFSGHTAGENAKDATRSQERLSREAIASEEKRFNQVRSDLLPFVQGGQGLAGSLAAASTLEGLPTFGGDGQFFAPQQQAAFGQSELPSDRPATPAEVSQLYRDILGREPDAGGLQFYLNEGFSPAAVAQAHRGSKEYGESFQAGRLPNAELGIADPQQQVSAQPGPKQGGFGDRIDAIFNSGALSPLIDERRSAVEGQLASSGFRRSGAGLEAAAAVPTELAFALEDQLFNRLANTVGSSQNAAAGLGALGSDSQGRQSTLLQSIGNARAAGLAGQNNAQAQGRQNAAQIGGALLSFFSDPRLKTNVVKIGEVAGINLYEWDWIDGVPDSIAEQSSVGFMADEVEQKYPQLIGESGGFKTINYDVLLQEVA